MKTLFISDLDGTLLNQNDSLSDTTIKTISRLQEDGMYFTYATARSYATASIVAKGLIPSVPVILYNGATMIDAATGALMIHTGFSQEDKNAMREALEHLGIRPMVYAYVNGEEKVSYLPASCNEGMQYYLDKRSGDKRMRAVDTDDALWEGDSFYVTCIGDEEALQPAYEALRGDARFRITFQQELYRKEYWLEIMPACVSKANAILLLKEKYGFDRIISFGDSMNDIPMFEISDEAYAVENAADALKEIATDVIESNEADGVAKWLSYHWQEERLLAGELYDTSDELLEKRRCKAHHLSKDYNDTYEEQGKERTEILRELLPHCYQNVYLQGPVQFDYGTHITFGPGCYANFNFTVLDAAPITIGAGVFFGPNCTLAAPVHPLVADERTFRRKGNGNIYDWEYGKPITIGDRCWIASNVTVCGGVTIGEDTVIGAGSVVTKDIPAGVLAAGNPCRVIRKITEEDRILPEVLREKDLM